MGDSTSMLSQILEFKIWGSSQRFLGQCFSGGREDPVRGYVHITSDAFSSRDAPRTSPL